jgi:hypothetical protein
MSNPNHQRLSAEVHDVEARLRDERPHLDAHELDRGKLRAMSAARRSTQKGPLMKSRLAITSMLVLGILMSTTGAGLAVTGGTVSQNSGQEASGGEEGKTLGQQGNGEDSVLGGKEDETPSGDNQALGGDTGSGNTDPEAQVAATGDGDGTLPFTGFLAIPLLIGGVALLGSGLMLRRRSA